MTILIDGKPLAEGFTLRALLDSPSLCQAAADFESRPTITVDELSKALCVFQSESCTVPWGHGYTVGSQDATTCVIALVVCSLGVSVLHVDESTCHAQYLEKSLRGVEDTEAAELHLLGAYCDEQGTSRTILRRLLAFYAASPRVLEVKLAYVDELNTRCLLAPSGASYRAPKICGVALPPCSRVVSPAIFRHRGPMHVERQARCMTAGAPADIFDAALGSFVFVPWNFELDRMTVKNFEMLLELDDEALVTYTSTSPMAEPASFAPDMRACLSKLVQYPSSALLFAPRTLQLSSSN